MTTATSKAEEAREIISKALDTDSDVCLTCSFQAEDMVALHLVRERLPHVPVLFLETGYHFAELYSYRDEMTARYGLNLVNVMPKQTVAEQDALFPLLNKTQPDQCCKLRKVGPLFDALEHYGVWFTGLRRVQSPTRANLQPLDTFPLPTGKQLLKVSALFDWTDREVWAFAKEHDIPLVSLYDQGYTSIGCEPCTALPADPANARSGRWAGRKLECGIHIAEGH
jgi:phosphoadenosine phosphosulfate reductase